MIRHSHHSGALHKRAKTVSASRFPASSAPSIFPFHAVSVPAQWRVPIGALSADGRAFSDAASDKSELTQFVNDINAAVVNADIAFLERVLHPDYVHLGHRGTVENRAEYLENRKTVRVEYASLSADEIKVRLYGDTAIVTYRSNAKGKDQHGEIDFQRLVTRVFLRRDGRWQQVHSQATPIKSP